MPLEPGFKDRLYELLIRNAREYAIFLMDPSGLIIDWNPGAEHMFGWKSEEVIGRSGSIIFVAEDRASSMPEREMETALSVGQSNDERWHLRNDGSTLYASGFMFALKDHTGTCQGFAKVVRDRTLERVVAAESRKTQQLLDLALGILQGGAWEIDLTAGTAWASPGLYELLGWAADLDLTIADSEVLLAPEDRQRIHQAAATPKAFKIDCTVPIRHPQRGERAIRTVAETVCDQTGCASRVTGVSFDVTEGRNR